MHEAALVLAFTSVFLLLHCPQRLGKRFGSRRRFLSHGDTCARVTGRGKIDAAAAPRASDNTGLRSELLRQSLAAKAAFRCLNHEYPSFPDLLSQEQIQNAKC